MEGGLADYLAGTNTVTHYYGGAIKSDKRMACKKKKGNKGK